MSCLFLFKNYFDTEVNFSAISQSCFRFSASITAGDHAASLQFVPKYLPVTPCTSLEEARYTDEREAFAADLPLSSRTINLKMGNIQRMARGNISGVTLRVMDVLACPG